MEIKEIRMKTGMSQTEFAKHLDIPVSTIRNWEQGIRKPPIYVLSLIKKVLEK